MTYAIADTSNVEVDSKRIWLSFGNSLLGFTVHHDYPNCCRAVCLAKSNAFVDCIVTVAVSDGVTFTANHLIH